MPHRYRRNRSPHVDPESAYEDDLWAQAFVAEHPDGATLEQVGLMFDVTRERIRQIESVALRRLQVICENQGVEFHDLVRHLGLLVQ